jgi:hypothetical protein
MVHGLTNLKFINAKQAGDTHAYRNINRKLHKTIAAIWFNKAVFKQQAIKLRK